MPIHEDTAPEDIEVAFITAINVLAQKYNCIIVDCDFATRFIKIEGPEEKQVDLANEISKLFFQWQI